MVACDRDSADPTPSNPSSVDDAADPTPPSRPAIDDAVLPVQARAVEADVTADGWTVHNALEGHGDDETLWMCVEEPVKLVVRSTVAGVLAIPAFRVRRSLTAGGHDVAWFEATRVGTYDVELQRPDSPPLALGKAVVLSHDEWQRRF